MDLELHILDKQELIRISQLVGYSNKNGELGELSEHNLKIKILDKVNPDAHALKNQYLNAFRVFNIKYTAKDSEEDLRVKLYEYNKKKLDVALSKMSKKKKKLLADQIESSIDPSTFEKLKKSGKGGVGIGGGILMVQAGAIAITGANLGICMLFTTGLSTISGILGVTFPFAAYMTAGVIGGYIIQAGHFLVSPFTAVPLLGLSTYLIYKKIKNKQLINLAGVNYLIETKKKLDI